MSNVKIIRNLFAEEDTWYVWGLFSLTNNHYDILISMQ